MGLRIITDNEQQYQVLYCTTTMQAFGPVHSNEQFDLADFCEWLPQDARKYSQIELDTLYYKWLDVVETPENH